MIKLCSLCVENYTRVLVLMQGIRVKVLTEDDVGNYSMTDVVLPMPGYAVMYPHNAVGDWYGTWHGEAWSPGRCTCISIYRILWPVCVAVKSLLFGFDMCHMRIQCRVKLPSCANAFEIWKSPRAARWY